MGERRVSVPKIDVVRMLLVAQKRSGGVNQDFFMYGEEAAFACVPRAVVLSVLSVLYVQMAKQFTPVACRKWSVPTRCTVYSGHDPNLFSAHRRPIVATLGIWTLDLWGPFSLNNSLFRPFRDKFKRSTVGKLAPRDWKTGRE